jgi:[ribosomal protein S5]-alanine N-acetyltransferase
MITAPEHIQTPRLTLRKPVRADAADMFSTYACDPEATRYLMWHSDGTRRAVEEFLERSLAGWDRGSAYTWSIILRENSGFLGMIEARLDAYIVNISYVLGRAYWNRGFATEAVREVCAWAESQSGVFRIWAVCAVDNPASARVLEKAGMVREGILRRWAVFPNIDGTPRDCYSYVRVRDSAP